MWLYILFSIGFLSVNAMHHEMNVRKFNKELKCKVHWGPVRPPLGEFYEYLQLNKNHQISLSTFEMALTFKREDICCLFVHYDDSLCNRLKFAKINGGPSYFHLVALYGMCNLAQLLIDKNVPTISANNNIPTPLNYCVSINNSHMPALLIQNGANVDINTSDQSGNYPLSCLINGNRRNRPYPVATPFGPLWKDTEQDQVEKEIKYTALLLLRNGADTTKKIICSNGKKRTVLEALSNPPHNYENRRIFLTKYLHAKHNLLKKYLRAGEFSRRLPPDIQNYIANMVYGPYEIK